MNIIANTWREVGQTQVPPIFSKVGFVLMENAIGEISCRIGCALPINLKATEEQDQKNIAKFGGKLKKNEALAFFPEHADLINSKWKE